MTLDPSSCLLRMSWPLGPWRAFLHPGTEDVPLLLGDVGQIAERHVLGHYRLLVDLLRTADDLVGRVEHHPVGRLRKARLRGLCRMTRLAPLRDDRLGLAAGY